MIAIPEEVKSKVIRFRVTEEYFKKIKKQAKQQNCTMSLFIENCINLTMKS